MKIAVALILSILVASCTNGAGEGCDFFGLVCQHAGVNKK